MRLTTRHYTTAKLVADDRLTDSVIAREIGINKDTLETWKKDPDFAALVRTTVEDARAAALTEAIAHKGERMRDYQELRKRLWATIMARADDARGTAGGDVFGRVPAPGAEHGLMVFTPVPGGRGLVGTWAVDTAVIAEVRNLDKQAAQEMGEWTEKREVTGKDGGPIEVTDARDELARRLAQLAARARPTEPAGDPQSGAGGGPAVGLADMGAP